MAVLITLGFAAKAKESDLTAEELKAVCEAYEKTYGSTLEADKLANLDAAPVLSAEEVKTIAEAMGKTPEQVSNNAKDAALEAAKAAAEASKQVAELAAQVEALKREPDTEAPSQAQAKRAANMMVVVRGMAAHTSGHLFGIEDERFSRAAWYNQMMIDRKAVAVSDEQKAEFDKAFVSLSHDVRNRMAYLNENGLMNALDFGEMIQGRGTIDYSELNTLAGEYVTRRTDLILAYFRSLPSVSGIFPVISGIQNKQVAPTANFGGLSQGYRSGRIFKGNVKFSAEIYEVVDVMFKYNFTNLQDLEKQYIGYLNMEGSNVIKWTFIEWVMVNFGTILISEQNKRRVSGVRVPQQSVVANPSNLAADGILRAIERAEEAFKILPFSAYGTYAANSILDTVEGMWDKFTEVVPSTDGYKIYINARHKQWYVRAYRTKYGTDADFSGSHAQLVDLAPESIVWVPNMPKNCFKIWIAQPGNVVNLEFVPGEMTAFSFTPEFEGIVASSRWKEGSHIQAPGVKYASLSDLTNAGYKDQFVFTNSPISALTITSNAIDVSANLVFELDNHATTTGEGDSAVTTPAADINTVTKYADDQCIKFVAKAAGDSITKAGAFSTLATAFTAGAAGDYIVVYPQFEDYTTTVDGETITASRPTGKFLELRRSVTA